jgi:hypothetical protein
MPAQAVRSATAPGAKAPLAACRTVLRGVTLTRVQAVIATLTGVVSIVGGVFSLVPGEPPVTTGELVAVVQAADARRSVSDATIEVLTTENVIVATLTPDSTGQATKELREGVYVVRVRHPRFIPQEHRIQVVPKESVQMRAILQAPVAPPQPAQARGSRSPIKRALGGGVKVVRKALPF